MSKMKKQKTLGFFNFTKKVKHRGELIDVTIPDEPVQKEVVSCPHCTRTFKNYQGLGPHLKCIHGVHSGPESKTVTGEKRKRDLSIMKNELIEDEVKIILKDLVREVASRTRRKVNAETRKKYSAAFKAEVIHAAEDPNTTLRTVALYYKIDCSMVQRWMKNKVKILDKAAYSHSRLHHKIRPAVKHEELNKELLLRFKKARRNGHRVDFHWIWSRARVIHFEQTGKESTLGKHVAVQFINKFNIKMRCKQRNKKKPREAFREDLQKWHATTRERLIRTGRNDNYDQKWGRFLPKQRLNVDQSPLPFAIDAKKTYDIVEKGNFLN